MTHLPALPMVALALALGSAFPHPPRGDRYDERLLSTRDAAPPAQPAPSATHLRIHIAALPDSTYRMVARLLADRGYAIQDGASRALTTGDRYVAGVGMVRLQASVTPDSTGAVVHLSGEWRRMRRLLILSAVTKDSVVIAYGAGGSRGAQAWNELAAIGEELGGDGMTYTRGIRP